MTWIRGVSREKSLRKTPFFALGNRPISPIPLIVKGSLGTFELYSNQTLLQVSLSIYILLGIQLLVLPWEVISYFARQSDKSRLRILTYTAIHLLFSVFWILKNFTAYDAVFEGLLVGTGIFLAAYSFYFWNKEFQLDRAKHKAIVLFAHSSFAFLGYLLFDQLLEDIPWGKLTCYLYIQSVVIYFVFHFFKQAFSQIDKAYPLRNAYVVASLSLLAIPFMLFFIQSFTITFVMINVGFLFITFTYIAGYIKDSRLETIELKEQLETIASQELESQHITLENQQQSEEIEELKTYIKTLENKEQSEEYVIEILLQFDSLTTSEFEIAKLLALGYSFQEIGEQKNIARATARKHASTVYSKVDVKNLDEFRKLFLN